MHNTAAAAFIGLLSRMRRAGRTFTSGLLDTIYPRHCISCRRKILSTVVALCPVCWHELDFIIGPHCFKCGRSIKKRCQCRSHHRRFYLDSIITPLRYRGNIKKIIARFKYNRKLDYVELFANLIVQLLIHRIDPALEWHMVEIPLHRTRLQQRGYNQAVILLHCIRKKMPQLKIMPGLVTRIRNNPRQANLKLIERHHNASGIFTLSKPEINLAGKNILIIDDVITSGATINECAKVLKKAGASRIYGVSIARTCRDDGGSDVGSSNTSLQLDNFDQ